MVPALTARPAGSEPRTASQRAPVRRTLREAIANIGSILAVVAAMSEIVPAAPPK
jgi:hypothetical protein